MRCSVETAMSLLERVAHHVLHKNELAYSLMCKFLEEHGILGTNTRASKFFKLLRESGFLILRHKYYHDPASGYRHGNFYVLSPLVTEDRRKEEEKDVSIISLPPSFHCHDDDDLELLYLRCQWCDVRFAKRLALLFEQKRAA
jgi:hypothetical protein